jgi:hypothetical protein
MAGDDAEGELRLGHGTIMGGARRARSTTAPAGA